jgi:hypothetical protein
MTECLPDLPRYVRQFGDNEWQDADHPDGPWRPIPAPQAGLLWLTDGPAVPESREPASVAAEFTAQTAAPVTPYGKTDEQARRDRAREAGKAAADASFDAVLAARSTPPPAPAGGLVERVHNAILAVEDDDDEDDPGFKYTSAASRIGQGLVDLQARAAIREVAAAAKGRIAPFDSSLKWGNVAQWLEQEADR